MANSVISKQELIDAQKDAKTLDEVTNGPAGQLVRSRLGREYYTLATFPNISVYSRDETYKRSEIDTAVATVAGGKYSFTTYAKFDAAKATIPANSMVNIDEAPTGTTTWGQGLNTWDGTTLSKSVNDPLAQAKNYTDAYASVKNKDISNISIDALQTRGQYRVTGSNLPTVTGLPFNSACDIQVYGETVTLWQLVKQYNSNNIAIRSSNGGSTVNWNPWVYMAFKSDVPVINVFPNPDLTSKKAALYSGSAVQEDGYTTLVMTGGSVSVSQTYYDVEATGVFAVGNTITLSAQVFADATGNTTSADIALIFYDSVGTALSTVSVGKAGAANTYEQITVSRNVPVNTTRIRIRFVRRTSATISKFKNVILQSSAQPTININASAGGNSIKTVYVSPTGLDTNTGTFDAPFLTMQKAASEVYPNGRVIMRGGDYIGTSTGFNIAGFDYFEADAYKDEKLRVIQGTLLTSVTKTAGYTKVYQAALTSSPYRYMFVHDVPDVNTLIPASERHPLQRGETYRLPSTKIVKVVSVAAIEAATKPSWYYDDVNKIVYFSVPAGTDALTAQIRLPMVGNGLIYGGTGVESVKISNMTVMYGGLRNVDARNLARFEYSNIFSFGGRGAGIVKNDTLVSIGEFNRAAANNDDGLNGHRYELGGTQNAHKETSMWTHDNGDDGESLHEYCIGEYNNILSEYNGDRGAAPAYGAHCTYNGFVFRKNGQEADRDDGAGIGVVGTSQEGVGTQAILYDGISDGNVTNYRAGAEDAQITAVNCHSFNAIEAGYAGDSGTVTITNCGDSGSAVIKRGNVVVKNTSIVS